MKKYSFTFVRRFKKWVMQVIMYRMSVVVVTVFALAGIAAGGVLYFLAYTTPISGVSVRIVSKSSVTVAEPLLEEVAKYSSAKEQSAKDIPTYSGVLFYVPPSTK